MENGSVKVFLRLRPTKYETTSKNFIEFDDSNKEKLLVIDQLPFSFNHIFHASSSQKEVFEKTADPLVSNFIDGFNCSLIALGASGSGKTFSMGLNNTTSDGMIGLSIDSLLQKLALKHQQADFNVFVSFIEIYKEKVFDLLTNGDESIYSKSKGNKFSGSRKIEIRTSDEASKVLNEGNKNRHTRATSLNSSSSRSHAIVTIYLSIHSDGSEISSLMHFADLAGSEGLRRTKHIGVAQQEGVNINQGLLAIGKVVQAMSNGLQVIPYRESTLTSVLKDSLNTNSYLAILGCISQNDKNETMSTVRFVHSVKSVKNMPEINVHQRLRTPLKTFMLPSSIRNEKSRTSGKFLKTPGIMMPPKHVETIKKSIVGSAYRYHSFNTPSQSLGKRKLLRQTDYPSSRHETIHLQESVDNNTFNVLNFSTSTKVGETTSSSCLQSNNSAFSYSPLMRQIEKTIDNRFSSFMDTFIKKSLDAKTVNLNSTFKKTALVDAEKDVSNFRDEMDSTYERTQKLSRSTCLMTSDLEALDENNEITVVEDRTLDNSRSETIINCPPPPRRSARISMYKAIMSGNHFILKPAIKQNQSKSRVKNEVASYFNEKALSIRKITKSDHRQAILEIINKGTLKELKLLPVVGLKTAYQIVTYRTINGRFETIDDLKSLSALKGKLWQNFLEANLLS